MKRILVQLVLVQKSYGCFNIRLWEPKPSLLRVRIHFGRLEDRQNSRGSFFFCSYYFFFELIFFPKSSLHYNTISMMSVNVLQVWNRRCLWFRIMQAPILTSMKLNSLELHFWAKQKRNVLFFFLCVCVCVRSLIL